MDRLIQQLAPLLFTGLVGLVPLLFISFFVWMFIRARKKAEERRRMFQQAAQMMGWAYMPAGDFAMIPNIASYYLFTMGNAYSRKIENMMYGTVDGGRAAVFDYTYVTGSGKNRQTHYVTVAYFQSNKLRLPLFSLRPENVFHKMFGAFGYQDIDFANRPEFSRQYLLRGQDEQNIRNVFSERVLSFYETQNQRLSTDAGGDQFFIYQEGVRLSPENIRPFVEWGKGLVNLFKNPW
ncbi:MAG: hypothetical protein H0X14_00605 [Acidobacteria bacterium]|nr:hypothetical protein [Acidobacteriota bacterium]